MPREPRQGMHPRVITAVTKPKIELSEYVPRRSHSGPTVVPCTPVPAARLDDLRNNETTLPKLSVVLIATLEKVRAGA